MTIPSFVPAFFLCGAVLFAQEPSREIAGKELAPSGSTMTITSSAFGARGTIPGRHADYGEKISPDLAWNGVPASARSFVVIVEDPDATAPKPFVHWVLYNVPATLRALPESIPATPRLPEFGGALQGRNSRGTVGYFGPRPPKGDRPHRYHFQIFALDALLDLDPGATATAVLAAMQGRVVGRAELVGVYRAP